MLARAGCRTPARAFYLRRRLGAVCDSIMVNTGWLCKALGMGFAQKFSTMRVVFTYGGMVFVGKFVGNVSKSKGYDAAAKNESGYRR
jgi:hypothetical protein